MSDPRSLAALREQLLEQIGAFGPVRPLRFARWLLPALLVLAGAGVAYFAMVYAPGLRGDRAALGLFGFWGLTVLQVAVATGLLLLVLREAVPGRRPAVLALGLGTLVGLACHAGTLLASNLLSPTALPASMDSRAVAFYCLKYEIFLGLPVLGVLLWIASRGLPTSPLRLAILGGVGAALVGDAVWRLVCPVSDPDHVLRGHSPAFLFLALVALLVTWLWGRWRAAPRP